MSFTRLKPNAYCTGLLGIPNFSPSLSPALAFSTTCLSVSHVCLPRSGLYAARVCKGRPDEALLISPTWLSHGPDRFLSGSPFLQRGFLFHGQSRLLAPSERKE